MTYLKGRGAQINTPNRFHRLEYDPNPIDWELAEDAQVKTQYIEVYPKTILNEVKSPDIPLEYSMNPYQGCEHGCVYCYARNTHPYWGYSAGLEFEQKILVKKNAAKLLEEQLKKKSWKAAPIMLSGNTDCYQPAEQQFKITRQILEVLLKYRHPVGLITKNSMLLRDLDLLTALNEHQLLHVSISLTSLDDKLRQFLEPRTATVKQRLKAIKVLSEHDIPVNVMMAPIIPSINDHEIFELVKTAADAGARTAHYTLVRLNGDVAEIFTDWIQKNMPDRAAKVLNKIKSIHGGQLGSSTFGARMRGQGQYAEIINSQFRLAREKFLSGREIPPYNLKMHQDFKTPQLKLF